MATASLDPTFTVSPQVLASNLVVMGSVPPVVPKAEAEAAIAHHGEAYALELFEALSALDRKVEGYTT